MKKRTFFFLFFTCLLILTVLLLYINYLAPAITGYAAKNLASGIFVAGRTQESIEREDINFFPFNLSSNTVDFDNKVVTSRFLLWSSKAVFNEGLGCTLIRDYSEESVKKLNYPKSLLRGSNMDTIPWPSGDLMSDTVPKGINMQEIKEIVNQVFEDSLVYKGTFAVIITYKDQIIAERYRDDLNPTTRFLSWSMAKSFTNAYVAILVKRGNLDINMPINLDEWRDDDRKNITLNNLLQMNSGLKFNEIYNKYFLPDAPSMLMKKGDMGGFAASKKLCAKPNSKWSYSSGSTNIIQDYIRTQINNDEEYYTIPQKALFQKIGMNSIVWEPDASGTLVGSTYLYASARDYVRFGLLYLHNGYWFGEQLFPENWVAYTTTPVMDSEGNYGSHFWLNQSNEFPGCPADLFYCEGYDGQFIFIIPSKQLVVVRTGCSPNNSFDSRTFVKKIVNSIESDQIQL
jgi:CubicO group peptidase (beta-lactamase class C family)